MGFEWPITQEFTEMPELREWQSVFEEENRNPFVYPTIKSLLPPTRISW